MAADLVYSLQGDIPRVSVNNPALRRGETLSIGGGIQLRRRPPSVCVTFVFDDGPATDYTTVYPIFTARGVSATSALISTDEGYADVITTGTPALSTSQALEMQANGWEFACHSASHGHFAATTDIATLTEEWVDSKLALEARGLTIVNAVYPYGEHNQVIRELLRNYYRSAVSVGAGVPNTQPVKTYQLDRIGLDSPATLDGLKAQVDTAIENNQWLIIMGHSWYPTFASGAATFLGELLDYILAEGVPILTLDKGLDYYANLLDTAEDEITGHLRIDGRGRAWFRGKRTILPTGTVDGTTPPTSQIFASYEQTVQFVRAAGAAGLPTSGAGTLTTTNDSNAGDFMAGMRQTWQPTRSSVVYERFPASDSTWTSWLTIDATGNYGEAVLSDNFNLSSDNTWQDTGLSISLPGAGTYLISADIRFLAQSASGGQMYAGLWSVEDSAIVVNSETLLSETSQTTYYSTTAALNKIWTVTAGRQVKLYARRNAVSWSISRIASGGQGRTRLRYIKIA